jgi:hypothetical protein
VLGVLGWILLPGIVTEVLRGVGLLLYGWAAFLARVAPHIATNWDLIGMAVVCLAGGGWLANIVLSHVWMAWRFRTLRPPTRPWRWQWTAAALGAAGILFACGTAVSGLAASVSAALKDQAPVLVKQTNGRLELIALEGDLRMLMAEHEGAPASMRDGFGKLADQRRQGSGSNDGSLKMLGIVNEQGRITGSIVFHNDRSQRERWGILLSHGSAREFLAAAEIPALLERHRGRLLAL